MLKKVAFCIFALISCMSFSAYAVEEAEEDILSCKDCKVLACDEAPKETPRPVKWC